MRNLLRAGALALALAADAPALAQADAFGTYADTPSGPCRHWEAVTPSDSANLTKLPKALYVGGAGDITMIGVDAPANATGVVWKALNVGAILPVRPRRILATGTTATLIVACF